MLEQIFGGMPQSVQILALLVMVASCLTIIVASICRLNLINAGKYHKWTWVVCYALYAGAAANVLVDLLAYKKLPSDSSSLAVIALALNILLTSKSWKGGRVPPIMNKNAA